MKKFLNTFEDDFCAIILLIMLILTFINVIARYIILASMPFVEELNCVGLMILSILGAATAAKRQAHLGLSVITDLLPHMAQRVIALICDLLGAAFCAAIVYLGYLMVQNQLNNNILSMGMSWPVWLYGIWLPIGGAVLFIREIQLAIRNFIAADKKEENE